MNFKRLKIKDFGPIREIEFNFEKDTMYHFVGDNDTGKSMVLDAMNILCNNIAGIHVKKYVSDYAESFFIEAEDFEGNIIQLKRGAVSYYNLILPDGTEKFYDKIGSGVPVSIQNIVNVYVDELKNEKFNFRYSDDKIIFMNTTAGENYSFFQKALRTDKVLNALKKANTLQNGLEKEIDITVSKIEFEKEKLENSPDITYIQEELDTYRNSIKITMSKAKMLYEIREDQKTLDSLEKISIPSEIMEFDSIAKRKELQIVVNSKEILREQDKLNNIELVVEKSKELAEEYESIKQSIEVIKLVRQLTVLLEKNGVMAKVIENTQGLKEIYDAIEGSKEELTIITTQKKLTKEIELLEMKEKYISKSIEISKEIADVYTNNYLNGINIMMGVGTLQEGLDELKVKNDEVSSNQQIIEKLDAQRTKLMRENNFCPVVANSVTKRCPFSNKTLEELVREV